jgi:hypothetical protein
MTQDDDATWLDALAGHKQVDDSQAAREAAVLRASVLARAVVDDPVPRQDPVREKLLLERARDAGLLPRRRRLPLTGSLLAAAAIICVAVALGVLTRRPGPAETVRSAPDGIVRLESADPTSLQREILDELRGAGLVATGYERLGRMGLDADLPLPLAPEVERILERHAIPVPPDGVLRVEIAPPGTE